MKHEIPGDKYWSPFERFTGNPAEKKKLRLWRKHYKKLGIRTKVDNGNLMVHVVDDFGVYTRDMPAKGGDAR